MSDNVGADSMAHLAAVDEIKRSYDSGESLLTCLSIKSTGVSADQLSNYCNYIKGLIMIFSLDDNDKGDCLVGTIVGSRIPAGLFGKDFVNVVVVFRSSATVEYIEDIYKKLSESLVEGENKVKGVLSVRISDINNEIMILSASCMTTKKKETIH